MWEKATFLRRLKQEHAFARKHDMQERPGDKKSEVHASLFSSTASESSVCQRQLVQLHRRKGRKKPSTQALKAMGGREGAAESCPEKVSAFTSKVQKFTPHFFLPPPLSLPCASDSSCSCIGERAGKNHRPAFPRHARHTDEPMAKGKTSNGWVCCCLPRDGPEPKFQGKGGPGGAPSLELSQECP